MYICSVRTSVLAIRAESRERQDLIDTASEQDITDTTPFKSHLIVAFIFHTSFEIHDRPASRCTKGIGSDFVAIKHGLYQENLINQEEYEIDRLVYHLYDLTEKIAIVEGRA